MKKYKRTKTFINNEKEKNSNIELKDGKGNLTIFDLPNEIILKIFSYLKPSCLLLRVSLVCKSWKSLAEDPSLYKTLHLNLIRKSDFTKVFDKFKFAQELSISGCSIESHCLRDFSRFLGLRSLTLSWCTIPHFEIKGNYKKLSLTSLKLYRIKITNYIFEITDLNILKCLDIRHCENVGKESIITSFKKCNQLEIIHLHFVKYLGKFLNDKMIDSIIQTLSDTLISFSVSMTTENALVNLSKCSKLTALFIHAFHSLTNSVLSPIMNLSQLKILCLDPCNFVTSEGIIEMFTKGHIHNLISLDLVSCDLLTDSSLITIANSCKKLSILKLHYNTEVTDEGVSTVINQCPEITELWLHNFTNLKGNFLLEIKENILKNLKKIVLIDSFVKRKYIATLKAARPNVQIVIN